MSTPLSPNAIKNNGGSLQVLSPLVDAGSLVAVTSDWCGHCNSLKRNVQVAQQVRPFDAFYVDGEKAGMNKLREWNVQGYPTIYRVERGGSLQEYNGSRSAESLAQNFH